ncbi:MAG: ATP-binding protein [Desulfobulbaceae bacterium]|nr:ATP-binding protein [Desulfobulbaceae bacterium]HIJ78629.1 two-component sensor histidine kinase [Deltaproteobacteria bacterium]
MHNPKHTIKYRIVRLYLVIVAIISLLITAYSWQMLSIERKLTTLENFHALFDNVLEVRRYEKNFLLNVGGDNLEKIIFYLDNIDRDIEQLGGEIASVAGYPALREFQATLRTYKATFTDSSSGISVDPQAIRNKGKALVNFVSNFLALKQARIKKGLKLIVISYILVTAVFIFSILLLFRLQVRNVLHRISFLQKATNDLVNDNFTPITDYGDRYDEVSELILAFNKMAAQLNIKQDQLIQSRKLAAIGTFSSGIAHELNNPLNNISLSADTLIEEYNELDETEAKEILSDIMIQTDRASKIVRNLLDFSRDKAPSTSLLNIKAVTDATVKLIANQLRINAIWVEDYIPENLPEINGDFQKLQQVFLNLFINAIQVMPEGGLIYLEAICEPEGFIKINVGDTGSGIAPEDQKHIFDPFFTTKEVGKGTGLGLSIVYGIIKKHGGYIEVKSKMNVGTTFSVYLPIAATKAGEQ